MSYNVIAYQVDTQKIKEVWGSNDENLLNHIFTKYKKDIEEQSECFEVSIELYKSYLKNIIKGEINTPSENNYIYGYLYELICREYGKFIGEECFLSYLSEVVDDNHLAFIPIPSNQDWPEFHSVLNADLEKTRELFLNNQEEHAKEDYYIDEVNLIFNTATRNKKDLVFFGY